MEGDIYRPVELHGCQGGWLGGGAGCGAGAAREAAAVLACARCSLLLRLAINHPRKLSGPAHGCQGRQCAAGGGGRVGSGLLSAGMDAGLRQMASFNTHGGVDQPWWAV